MDTASRGQTFHISGSRADGTSGVLSVESTAASAFTWGNYGLSLWEEGHHSDALKAMMHARNLKPGWTAYDVKYREMRSKLRVVPSSIEHESNDAD